MHPGKLTAAAAGFVVCLWASGAGLTALRQAPAPAAPANGIIVGQVVDAATGRPIPGAVVMLSGGAPPRPMLPPGATPSPAELAAMAQANGPRRIMTDGAGAFAFHSLPKASFGLSASATGYLGGGFGQTRVGGPARQITLDEGERRTDVILKLWPYGGIAGTIVDEAGDPAVGVTVRVVRVTTTNGERRLSPMAMAQTDDRGIYRFGSLAPGDYLVVVPQTVTSMPASTIDTYMEQLRQPGGTDEVRALQQSLQESGAPTPSGPGIRIGDQQVMMMAGSYRPIAPPVTTDTGKTYAYETVYYPGTGSVPEASTLSVASGQERSGIDFQIRPTQTVRVSGSIVGPDGPAANLGVRLIPAGADDGSDAPFDTGSTATDVAGNFTFIAVPSGSYTLRAVRVPRVAPPPPPPPPGVSRLVVPPLPLMPTDPVFWAESPLSVAESPVTNVMLTLRPGARISGRVVFEGTSAKPTADAIQRMTVSVGTADGRPNLVNGAPGRVAADGSFTTLGYPPGKYVMSAGGNLRGWSLTSVMLGGRNLDDDPLDIDAVDVGGVTIVFSDKVTQVAGTVHDPSAARDLSATVLVFPATYATLLSRGTLGRRARSVTVGGTGAFSITGLPPGDYLAAAVNPDAPGDARDRAFYDSLSRIATRFTLADGESKSLDLTLSAIR